MSGNEPDYSWTQASALYEIEHGDMDSERTESAFDFLQGLKGDRAVFGSLLDIIADLRNGGS